jgi:predicted metal-dependent peptidase
MLSIGKPLVAEQRLRKAVIDIIGRDEFIALTGVLMIGTKIVDDKVKTACTNGRDEAYGRKFVDELSDAEFRFVVLHECYHKMYKHLTTWKHLHDVDHDKANRACDYVINHKLANTDACKEGWIKIPDGALIDNSFADMDSAKVFKLLQARPKGGDDDEYNPFDEHNWDEAQEMSEQEQKDLSKEIDNALRQGAILAGKVGTGANRELGELLNPKQDWRELLRDFVTTTCAGKDYSTWRRPNRRYVGMDILMPSAVSESLGEIVLGIDTSGSIGTDDLNAFLSEIKGICDTVKPSKIRLLYWDSSVCKEEVYLQDELDGLVHATKPAGGGGTDPTCVPQYLNEHGIKPECVVMLTDGYVGGWGTWSVPVLWCILNNNKATADVGKTVHI